MKALTHCEQEAIQMMVLVIDNIKRGKIKVLSSKTSYPLATLDDGNATQNVVIDKDITVMTIKFQENEE